MSDIEIRQLEREASQGNVYAIKRLVFAQLRAGLEPYKPFFMRLSASGINEFLGVPLTLHGNGRFTPVHPDMADIEDGIFWHHFLVNGYDAELVLARSVTNELSDTTGEMMGLEPAIGLLDLQHGETGDELVLEEEIALLEVAEYFDNGFYIIEDINSLGPLKLNQLYLPPTYDKRHIPEYEDEPAYPLQEITAIVKKPGGDPTLFHTITTPNFIEELLGEGNWTSLALKWISPTLRMYVSEYPQGRPNFELMIPAKVTGAERDRLLKMIEDGKADPGILAFMEPRLDLIRGTAVFVNTSVPEFDSIDWNRLPWPWNEIAKEDPDRSWPTSLEFTKLSDEDIELITQLLLF